MNIRFHLNIHKIIFIILCFLFSLVLLIVPGANKMMIDGFRILHQGIYADINLEPKKSRSGIIDKTAVTKAVKEIDNKAKIAFAWKSKDKVTFKNKNESITLEVTMLVIKNDAAKCFSSASSSSTDLSVTINDAAKLLGYQNAPNDREIYLTKRLANKLSVIQNQDIAIEKFNKSSFIKFKIAKLTSKSSNHLALILNNKDSIKLLNKNPDDKPNIAYIQPAINILEFKEDIKEKGKLKKPDEWGSFKISKQKYIIYTIDEKLGPKTIRLKLFLNKVPIYIVVFMIILFCYSTYRMIAQSFEQEKNRLWTFAIYNYGPFKSKCYMLWLNLKPGLIGIAVGVLTACILKNTITEWLQSILFAATSFTFDVLWFFIGLIVILVIMAGSVLWLFHNALKYAKIPKI
ncbi:membrane hypothetical protein [Candidatus Magnetomoraceae bacterium gMMP-15]